MAPVVEVEIEGQVFPARYDVEALCEYEEKTGKNLLIGNHEMDMRALTILAFVGMKYGHKYKFSNITQFGKSLEEFRAWLPLTALKMFPPILKKFTGGADDVDDKEKAETQGESVGAL